MCSACGFLPAHSQSRSTSCAAPDRAASPMGAKRSGGPPGRRTIHVNAFAKLNLSLRVLGVRRDGYHELRTVFQSIALHDSLAFRNVSGGFRIACDDAACPTD